MVFKIVYVKKEFVGIELIGYVNIGKFDVYDFEKFIFKF